MSADNTKLYKLSSVVDNFLIENDLSNSWFNKSLVWAMRGIREISLDTFQQAQSDHFPITNTNTVILPPGFVDFVIISGYNNGRCDTWCVQSDLDLLPRALGPTASQDGFSEVGYWLQGCNVFSYGKPIYTRDRFKVVDTGGVKILKMDISTRVPEIYLEWVGDGINLCGETIIHPYVYDYLIKYIEEQYEDKNNPKATEASKLRKQQDRYFAEKRLRARTSNLDFNTLVNIANYYTTLANKY